MIESIITICLEAGKEIMQVFHGKQAFFVNKKEDCSPVTFADLIANELIVSSLQKLTPDIPILSEEDTFSWEKRKIVDYFWVVDPLDGTKEFLSYNDEFTVNIALIKHGVPIIGVVYAPAMGILYTGMNNEAWKIYINTKSRLKVMVKKMYPPIVVVSRYHSDDYKMLNNYLMHLIDYRVIKVGSSLKFCLIAEGVAQIYPRFSSINIWDIAAGHAIAVAAGAVINDWDGCSLNYNSVLQSSFLFPGFHVFVS